MTPQHPIDSGFGAPQHRRRGAGGRGSHRPARDRHRRLLGLGLETVRALSGAGADVIVPARRPEHAAEVLAGHRAARRGRRARPRRPRQRRRVRAARARRAAAASTSSSTTRDHGVPRDPRRAGLGGAVRHQPPRPLRAREPAVAAAGGRRRRARRRAVLDRAQALADPLRRPAVRARLREVGGLRPGEDRQQPVRRPARRARPGRRRARVRGAPRRDHDAAAAPPARARR